MLCAHIVHVNKTFVPTLISLGRYFVVLWKNAAMFFNSKTSELRVSRYLSGKVNFHIGFCHAVSQLNNSKFCFRSYVKLPHPLSERRFFFLVGSFKSTCFLLTLSSVFRKNIGCRRLPHSFCDILLGSRRISVKQTSH